MQNFPQQFESNLGLRLGYQHGASLSWGDGTTACSGQTVQRGQRTLPRCAVSRVVLALWLALAAVNFVCADELEMGTSAPSNSPLAQELRATLIWQNAETVQARLGAPIAERAPVGTHASYSLWVYEEVVVAFANGRVIHVFDKRDWGHRSSQTRE